MSMSVLKYGLRQGILSLRRNLWLATVTAGIIAISLAILGGFLLLTVNVGQMMRTIETNLEIAVFLEEGVDPAAVSRQLDAHALVQGYVFVPKEQGLVEFAQTLGDPAFLTGMEGENNPLPDLFRVRTSDAQNVVTLAEDIRAFTGVETADYGEELVGRLISVTDWLNRLLLGMSALLALGAVFLIVTTIRLSVTARQDEVGIMKYLGASNSFIRFPFLLEGVVIGWTGTLVATIALGLGYKRLATSLQQETLTFFIRPVTDPVMILPIFGGLLLLGTLMGGIGSIVSVRKFLRV
ncbi:MAG: Cell division protein FtsX [Syntrophomonadaceae bacterium]|nr:Cell division protein FtsX [Bacillota bacterium]